jgi:MarR family 2-MHQ and catechol resistance regulon transcriptional repressor
MPNSSKKKPVLDLWIKLTQAYDMIRKGHTKHIAQHNLTVPQFGVLEVLYENGSMPLKKISEILLVTGANITCVVDNLEKEDLVRRVHSKEDRRIINAELTSKGKEKIEKILPGYAKNISNLTSKLEDIEQKDIIRLLDKMLAS